MIGHTLPSHLVELVHRTVDDPRTGADCSLAYLQLVASGLYEALQDELAETPRAEAEKRGRLAAAVDQCRRSADASLSQSLRLAELRATLSLLDVPRRPARPRFTVIEGGLSKRA